MRAAFPAFLAPQDAAAASADDSWDVPLLWLPDSLSPDDACVFNIKRLFLPRDTLVGFPFHLLMRLWLGSIHTAPPFQHRVSARGPHVIEIEFTTHRPPTAILHVQNGDNVSASLNGRRLVSPFRVPDGPFTLELQEGESWPALQWTLLCDGAPPAVGRDFIVRHSARFTDDIKVWQTVLTPAVDQEILRVLGLRCLETHTFQYATSPQQFVCSSSAVRCRGSPFTSF
jgi:hypothetical protein